MLLAGMAQSVQAAAHDNDSSPTYELVAENATFALYVDKATLAFQLEDRRSGYLWHSGIDELLPGDRLNKSWQAFAQSGVSIEYLDKKAVNKRISISNTAHTLDVMPIEQGIRGVLTFPDYGIGLELRLQLEEDGVRVEIPFASIAEEKADQFRLGLIYIYPFLGATRGNSQPGYFLLPDGTGSLLHFTDATRARNMFYGRYYGADLGMLAALPFDPQVNRVMPISYPVFGVVHGEGQNGLLSVVESGAAYGELQVHPAGIITNFNFIYHAFIYNESYFQATNRSGAGVTVIQPKTNPVDVVVHYRFVTGEQANYVGLARSYQRYLVQHGLLRQQAAAGHIGLRLEVLAGDYEKVLFWNRFVSMTTIEQMAEMLRRLEVNAVDVTYYGWQPLGASSMPPKTLRLERSLGNLQQLQALAEQLQANGGTLSLYFDPLAAIQGEVNNQEVAMAITNLLLQGNHRNNPLYYLSLATAQERYAGLVGQVTQHSPVGLALDEVGNLLYSDFRRGQSLSRQQALEQTQALVAASADSRLTFYRPNDYMWGQMTAYYDMPLGDNGYLYTDETVPFLPIVMAGYVPMYGPPLNFSSDMTQDLLRQVDFGIYPTYFLTEEPTAKMLNTRSSWVYTSSYQQWGERIRQAYAWMDGILGPVRGEQIVARRALAQDVYATTYGSGKTIVVNYGQQPFEWHGQIVNARDAALWEKMP
jgi:hypothetical protein